MRVRCSGVVLRWDVSRALSRDFIHPRERAHSYSHMARHKMFPHHHHQHSSTVSRLANEIPAAVPKLAASLSESTDVYAHTNAVN